jgi:hypothetical protein
MTAAEILAFAKSQGITILFNGDDLELVADRKPAPELLDAIAGCKAEILSILRTERRLINLWVANRIISWPRDRCLHCKLPILPGAKWIDVASGDELARFHVTCHPEWVAQQEVAARKTLGLDP